MTHILHLGHQNTDLSGVTGHHATDAGYFDASLDVNSLYYFGTRALVAPFSLPMKAPRGISGSGFAMCPPPAM